MAEPLADVLALDSAWLRDNPLPDPDPGSDKNSRGKVLIIGGSTTVPGGLLLTAEAALRSAAGKVQVATTASTALALGMAMPEIAVFPLKEDGAGEIAALPRRVAQEIARCDVVVAGPAMGSAEAAGKVVNFLLGEPFARMPLILDAAALMSLDSRAGRLRKRHGATILTPHIGEMAALLGCEAAEIQADPSAAVRRAAKRYGAIVVLKGATSLIAAPDGSLHAYAGGSVGLATSGSGDVLAGIAAGLVARGANPLQAALWAVWLHGEAGRRCGEQIGPLGFLARELLAQLPGLMRR